jgi:glutamyl-tRNA(Gln) amidotransferase subunit E
MVLAMKIGFEIHQQLAGGKLFCRCPAEVINRVPDKVFKRRLKAISGEMGEVDVAAYYEQKKDKDILYEFYDGENCLVELDEEPPHEMDRKALETAVKIGLLLDMKILEEIHVMRKSVVDGSNPSGFQRTALVGVDGSVKTKEGTVGVNRLYLEEESAKRVEEGGTIFRLDRLGIPLVEIRTEPDIKSPEQAYEVAAYIGRLLRTCDVRRGIGSIRQDVNISIPGGNKVEIKGFQDLRSMKKVIDLEVKRQEGFLKISKKLKKRRAAANGTADISRIIEASSSNLKSNLGKATALRLRGFKDLLKEPAGLSRIGLELAQMARNFGLGGVVHSDELPSYGMTRKEVDKIRKKLSCTDKDAFLFIVGKKDHSKIIEALAERANKFVKGVPEDVRAAKNDGTTVFLRPTPGSARMYPETDLFPVKIERSMVRRMARELPEKPEKALERYVNMGLGKELSEQILRSAHSRLFDKMISESKLKPSLVASMITGSPGEFKKMYGREMVPSESWLVPVLSLLEKGIISKNMVPQIMYDISQGKKLQDIASSFVSEREIDFSVKKVLKKNKGADTKKLVGLVLADLKGRANPSKVYEVLKKNL